MRILITGSSGFVGQALLRRIEGDKCNNEILLLSSKENSRFQTFTYRQKAGNYEMYLPDDFDILVHLGAWTPKSTKESQDIEKGFENIQFTKTLLNLLPSLKRVVYISTLDVYASTTSVISEGSLVNPISLYGYSKLYCEEMVKAWTSQNGAERCILRLGHIYGVGEAAYKKLIPMFIQHALKDETINIFSGGNELRSFLNIDDCANVILQSAFGKMQGLYNVVSSHAVSVRDIAQTIKSIAESNSEIVIQNRPIETRDMVFDNTHLKETFSFEEKPLELGLKEEIDYFKQLIA